MESLREMVNESLEEIETRKENVEREALLEALRNYTEKVKEGLRQCGLHYKYNHDYFRVEYNGLTAACGFVSDLVSIPRSATTVDIIGRDSHLLNRYREAMAMINTLREHQLDDLEEAVGGDLQELERKVEEAEKVYINKHGEGSYAIKRILEKMLNRLRNNGQVDIKFYDINLAHPDNVRHYLQTLKNNIVSCHNLLNMDRAEWLRRTWIDTLCNMASQRIHLLNKDKQ